MTAMEVADFNWQLVVVDNADDAPTKALCESFTGRLPLDYLVCAKPGKNAALNFGLKQSVGELIVFTDDDVLPAPNWLRAMIDGSTRWPSYALFGGRVLPDWPSQPSDLVMKFASNSDQGRWTYGVFDPALSEGPHHSVLPMGANMGVRRTLFDSGVRFNEAIGPNGSNFAMGSETEFNLRLQKLGHEAVFLPDSLVYHQIRAEQLDPQWLVGRAFREGRGVAARLPDRSFIGLSRVTKLAIVSSFRYYRERIRGKEMHALAMQMKRAHAVGKLYETLWLGKYHVKPDKRS